MNLADLLAISDYFIQPIKQKFFSLKGEEWLIDLESWHEYPKVIRRYLLAEFIQDLSRRWGFTPKTNYIDLLLDWIEEEKYIRHLTLVGA